MTLKEEIDLVEKAKSNLSSFDTLYLYYLPKIYTYCLNRLGNKEVAEDITSQIFISAVEGIHYFDTKKGNKFGTWLYRVAHNKIVDYFRKKKSILLSVLKVEPSKENNYDEELKLSEKQKQIIEVLKKIKPRYQQVITLKFFSELDNAEIAETIGISKSNVALILHRALKSFKIKFKRLYPKSEIFDLN